MKEKSNVFYSTVLNYIAFQYYPEIQRKMKEKRLSFMPVWNSGSFIQLGDVLMFLELTYLKERALCLPLSPSKKLVDPGTLDLLGHSLVKGCGSPLEGFFRPSEQWNRQWMEEFAFWKQFFLQTRVLHAVDINRRVQRVYAGKECKTFRAGNVSLPFAMGEDSMIHACKLYIWTMHSVQQMARFCWDDSLKPFSQTSSFCTHIYQPDFQFQLEIRLWPWNLTPNI